MKIALLCIVCVLSLFIIGGECDLDAHSYEDGEQVILWVNKVGPYRNPQETYFYYSLPFCQPSEYIESDHEGLGESIQGYELIMSPFEIRFKVNTPQKLLCTKKFTREEADKMKNAIANQYWYQLFLDDLPIWGMVGEVLEEDAAAEDAQVFIFTHIKLSLQYNENRVIEVDLEQEKPVLVEAGKPIAFTYSITWTPTTVTFDDRFDKYLDSPFFEHQIHFFSIFNSFMMVIFLVGLVSMILMRTLKKDYARFGREDADMEGGDDNESDESGWKQVHGDVFRAPPRLMLFSALVGTGHQLVVLTFMLLFISMAGAYYRNRGAVVTAFIVCYAFTSFLAGYGGGGYYARNGGKHWIKTMLLTAGLFPGCGFVIAFLLNCIAFAYESLAYISFASMMAVVLIWAFISFPLTLFGTLVGKNWNGAPDHPCRIGQLPRHIPPRPWYLERWVNVALGGLLPFGSIFIEMYFIFSSFWHYKYYYVYTFLLLVYIILIIVTVCVTIVSTYFLLNAEDYRWKWASFASAASTSIYVFLYACYYFFFKTKMSGFFQTVYYFSYSAMFALALAILCGSIGFIGSSVFVRRIYRNIKID